jgi:hypothetical protein
VKLRRATGLILAIILTAMMAAGTFLTCQQRMASTGLYRQSYEGKVVNKSATFRERQTGSAVQFRLAIKSHEGDQFEVAVDHDVYERAQIGMWIKKDGAGLQLDRAVTGGGEDLKR